MGFQVGACDGCELGWLEGTSVGYLVGMFVGTPVGSLVGMCEGWAVGGIVGLTVGSMEGNKEGSYVGLTVGGGQLDLPSAQQLGKSYTLQGTQEEGLQIPNKMVQNDSTKRSHVVHHSEGRML